jgi:hypothetical protein
MMTTAAEGIEYSERPGFTVVGGHASRVGPVAVRVDGSRESFEAIRAAADHAMVRTCGMIVIGDTDPPGSTPQFDDIDEREQSVAQGIFQNDHVSLLPAASPSLSDLAHQVEDLQASLLVLNVDEVDEVASSPALMARMINAPFDLLLLAPGHHRHS